ncbi:unnamed protein product [Orchesella dallaii]|uniref:GT23 domain-containing protein n=1 Tax=Orchesella dallaii TaxID=48710 RepID=A0ABP1R2A5_9HEXA
MKTMKRAIVHVFLIIIICSILSYFYISLPQNSILSKKVEEIKIWKKEIVILKEEIVILKKEIVILKEEIVILKIENDKLKSRPPNLTPTREYEKTLQNLERDITNLTKMIGNRTHSPPQSPKSSLLDEIQTLLLSHVSKLRFQDGYNEFRRMERKELGQLVQGRILALQNPPDCSKARKLLCLVDHPCGFGCLIHHIVYCLMTAYSTNRTLILKLNHLYGGPPFDKIFEPLSSTCNSSSNSSLGKWGGPEDDMSTQVLSVKTFESMITEP